MMRRRVRGDTVSLDDAGDDALAAEEAAASDAPSAEQFVEAAHARALLEHAIDALPDNFRMVFVLRAVEGLDVRETAECLGVNADHRAHAAVPRAAPAARRAVAPAGRAKARRSSILARSAATAWWHTCWHASAH